MKSKNTFSKTAGFRQVIALGVVMLAFTITSFALSSMARNVDGDDKVIISGELRQRHAVTLDFSGPFATEANKDPNPFEGFRFAFNGKDGRIETHEGIHWRDNNQEDQAKIHEKEMDQSTHSNAELKYHEIVTQRNFDDYKRIEFPFVRKGHWGGDKLMFGEIFRGVKVDPKYNHAADVRDGSMAVLIGIAARISINEQRPVKITELTDLVPRVNKWSKS